MKQFYNLFGQTIFSNYIIKQKKLPKKKKIAYSIQKCWKFKIVHFDFILFYFIFVPFWNKQGAIMKMLSVSTQHCYLIHSNNY